MIAAAHRFHGRHSLRYVYQKGKTVRDHELSLRFILNNRNESYRVAVVVSRKVSKSAVVRNRIRRRMYELVRTHAEHITGPYDLVFTIYDEAAAHKSHPQLLKSVLRCLERSGVIKVEAPLGKKKSVQPTTDRGENSPGPN